jgi:hypothetical protein
MRNLLTKPSLISRSTILTAVLISMLVATGCHSVRSGQLPGTALTSDQTAALTQALQLMRSHGLVDEGALGQKLLAEGIWRAATTDDKYIGGAEKAGDTPFAYTLSPGHNPVAIVLAARFFDQATPLGQAAVMIHEMGHYKAYVKNGRSVEYDGYKAEYDSYPRLGLSDKDGLVYFSMLDGTAEYVVPRDKTYAKRSDLKQFLSN